MLKLQQFILNLLSLIFLTSAICLIVQNFATGVDFQFLTQKDLQLPLGILIALGGILTALALACRMLQSVIGLKHNEKLKHREVERHQIALTGAQDQVKVLESKIESLEKALSESLKSSTNPEIFSSASSEQV